MTQCKICKIEHEALLPNGICEACWQKGQSKLKQAVDELWQKIQDMQQGQPLTQAEWIMILAEIEKRIAKGGE